MQEAGLLSQAAAPSAAAPYPERRRTAAVDWLLRGLVLILAFQLFFLQSYRVQGHCMEPNVYTGDRLWGSSLLLNTGLHRGDIVVFEAPETPGKFFIKRIVALPGEVIAIHENHVYVNGRRITEPYLANPWFDEMPPTRVDGKSVWVMGDNRDQSNDSRLWGCLPLSHLRGRAMMRYWPISRIGLLR